MNTSRLLRAASFLALVQYGAHAALFLLKPPAHGTEELAVIAAMKSHVFDFAGFDRSYWDFYFGYGLLAILFGIVEIILLWLLARMAKTNPAATRPFVGLVFAANLAHAGICLRYFFLAPLLGDLVVAAVLVVAWIAARPAVSARQRS